MLPRQMYVTPVAEALEYVDEILKLQEQLKSAQQEIERLKQLEQQYSEFIKSWEKYQQDKEKMIEGLRWYADAVNYEYRTSYLDQDAPIIDDNGQRARNILR